MNDTLNLHSEAHQVAPNLRRTFGCGPETRNVRTEPPRTLVLSGEVNRLSMPPRLGSMTDMPDHMSPKSLVATDPKVIRAMVTNGLIATKENQQTTTMV